MSTVGWLTGGATIWVAAPQAPFQGAAYEDAPNWSSSVQDVTHAEPTVAAAVDGSHRSNRKPSLLTRFTESNVIVPLPASRTVIQASLAKLVTRPSIYGLRYVSSLLL